MPRAIGWELPYLYGWRRYRGLGAGELAARAEMSSSAYSRIEHLKARAGARTLEKLCGVLGLTREQLLHESAPAKTETEIEEP